MFILGIGQKSVDMQGEIAQPEIDVQLDDAVDGLRSGRTHRRIYIFTLGALLHERGHRKGANCVRNRPGELNNPVIVQYDSDLLMFCNL
jgi:hypothetical protein